MFVVSSHFIGNFKLGDNIAHNLQVLSLLYEKQNDCTDAQKVMLCKPIIVTIASICEAVLSDFHFKVRVYTIEGVENLSDEILNYIRGKKIDEFGKYIASSKKHNLFDANDNQIYESLDKMRKLRNRIHIQNTKNHFEPDEVIAFSLQRQREMEITLENVLKTMATKYPRPKNATGFVNDFNVPWEERLT